ncbi:MAG: hypothetical protein ACFFB3_17580, partial [Candidatus Hodarchaeota archaeon]
LFILTSLFCFANKAFLPQYLLYSIPYLALAFPSMFPNQEKRNYQNEDRFLAASSIFIPNFFALSLVGHYMKQRSTNFDDLFIHTFIDLDLFSVIDFTKRYDIVGIIDGRLFIICFILIVNLTLHYLLEEYKEKPSNFLKLASIKNE